VRTLGPFMPAVIFLALPWCHPLMAAPASLILQSEGGDLSHALVSFHAVDRDYEFDPDSLATMDQLNRQFRPRAIAIEQGGHVRFLNNDDVRHHVYSFSAPKRFELPLYQGEPPEDIHFEEPGEVILGCNIHDWMVGWVHVMDTPYFAFADEQGRAEQEIPPGEYELRIWHPRLRADDQRISETVHVDEEGIEQRITLELDVADDQSIDRRRGDRF